MRAALLATAALFSATAAHAQTRVNDQYQLRGTTAVINVEAGTVYDAAATAIAAGNVASAVSEDQATAIDNTQHMDGDARAEANATVWYAEGNVAVNASAIGNGGTSVSRNGDADLNSTQLAHGDASASARFTGGDAANAATSASASGNVAAVSMENGQAGLVASQQSTGAIGASVEADHCCVAGQVVSGAIASANNFTVGGDTATTLTDTTQSASGNVNARVDLYAGYVTDASGNATANANALTIDNEWGYVNARVNQNASAAVTAESYVTLGGDFLGFGSAGAYGVGNQAIVSNVGSDTVLDVTQTNSGHISADVAFVGEGGESALASAAAYGNSVTGSLCGYCDDNNPSLTASNDQINSGAVSANASLATPYARTAAATATAIGNAATYQVAGPTN
jgi:hypothetical protein